MLLLARRLPAQQPERTRLSAGGFLALACISYACMLVGNLVGIGINSILSPNSVNLIGELATSAGLTAETVIAFVVLAPVFEELVFRKVLVDHVLPFGEWPAILFSGIAFGLFHGNLTQFFYAALLGMVLAYVYIRTGNILYTIGIHACINFLGGVLPILFPAATFLVMLVAAAGIVRTKDLENWERLPNLVTLRSPQQRNVALHPEFVDGKYAFYTRPMDDFIETGSGGGIGFGLCEDILHPVIGEEKIISRRKYHTITEAKNGAGAVPIKTDRGWIHLAHGVRNTAAGLRYVLYAFATDLKDPSKLIAEPSGMLLGPLGRERTGDVSNVVFTNGAIADDNGKVYLYYASSDTRMHVAETDIERLKDYVFNTPEDPLRSPDCVRQRADLIRRNLEYLR